MAPINFAALNLKFGAYSSHLDVDHFSAYIFSADNIDVVFLDGGYFDIDVAKKIAEYRNIVKEAAWE